MQFTVRLFGPQAMLAQATSVVIDVCNEGGKAVTCEQLRGAMRVACPVLGASLGSSRFAINHAYADDAQGVSVEDEVALIGLVSGG